MQKNAVETNTIALTGARVAAAAILSCLLALTGFAPLAAMPARAYADDAAPSELQQRVEQTAADYNAATQRVQELEQQIADNKEQIAQIESELPQQQERAADAMCEQYKLQREAPGIIEMILGAGSISDFLVTLDYFSHVQGSNYAEISRLAQMRRDLETNEQELAAARDEALNQQQAAEQALAAAQAAREEAQRKAEEEAARQAAAAAAAAENGDEASDDASQDVSEEEGQDSANTMGPAAEEPSQSEPVVEAPSSDGADWSSDKASFVSQWAGRIDAYLAGSPLAGQGATFAEAAWDYGVDPRWSPAISNTESSKGRYCFLPYNAWGWGSSSWGSWEEAIRAHVQGLARGYGYTISIAAAQKYCPPNWEHWYNSTLAQMNMI